MSELDSARSATTDGLTVSPSLDTVLESAQVPAQYAVVDRRVLGICGLALGIGVAAGFIAQFLIGLIQFITNLAFFQRYSLADVSPADNHLGLAVIIVPVIGGLIVGFMARYGSKAIRGHGIPEAMEQVLTNQSRIPARLTFLKPVSAAIAIGTGGPFGAEGPIIATGGALGSLIGQIIRTTPAERKTLLSAGAAAGMAATFGSPVAAMLLAVELLLFEFRPRSIIPVPWPARRPRAFACCFAASRRPSACPKPSIPARRPGAFTFCSAPSWAWWRSRSRAAYTPSRISSSGCPCIGCGGRPSARWWWAW